LIRRNLWGDGTHPSLETGGDSLKVEDKESEVGIVVNHFSEADAGLDL